MITVNSKEALEAVAKMEKRNPGCLYQIRKGTPDARSPRGYYLYVVASYGVQMPGTYGAIVHHAKTLKALIEYINAF